MDNQETETVLDGKVAKDGTRKPTLGQLVKTLMGVGCVGFGGGSALIPVLEDRLVHKNRFVSQEEFNNDIVIASVTPGALPVEISAGVGGQSHGPFGMIAAASAISLPGVTATVLALALLSQFGDAIIEQVGFLSIGALAYILCVLLRYAYNVIAKASTRRIAILYMLIALFTFALIGEGSLVKLFGLQDTVPIINIGIVEIIALAFFLAFWLHGDYSAKRMVPGCIVSAIFLVAADGSFGLEDTLLPSIMPFAMLAMALVALKSEIAGKPHLFDMSRIGLLGKEILVAFCFLLLLNLPAAMVYDGTIDFTLRGVLSALSSFGGGDAYLALADGIFVSTGIVLYADFYSQLVPVANALPGSILCKVLSGMGFFVGYRATGDIGIGLLVALSGFSCSIAMSSTTFSVASFFYSGLEHFRSFKTLQRVIAPIIVGLMGSVAVNLMRSCTEITVATMPTAFAPLLCLALCAVGLLFMRKFGNRALVLVLGLAIASCVICNVLVMVL